jgi:outer membrane lipoprotein-sorting protein
MLIKKFLLMLMWIITGTLFAQNAPQSATSILEKTAQKFTALTAFSLDFIVKVEENGKTVYQLSGTAFGKKEKYLISLEDQTVANDGKMMWNYQKNTNEALLFETEDDDFLMFHPTKILNNWNEEYAAKFIKEEELQNKQVFVVDLTPKNKAPFYKIRLFIDETAFTIQQVMMYEAEGATITYSIAKFTPNAAVPDAKFTFNKNDYPKVQIIDLR